MAYTDLNSKSAGIRSRSLVTLKEDQLGKIQHARMCGAANCRMDGWTLNNSDH